MTAIKQNNFRINLLNQWLPITSIMLLATGLYLYQLGTESMWIDELYSINDAKGNISLLEIRPIYYLLLKFWMLFGTSDSWLRSLSVIFGLGSVFLIYQLGRRVAGEATGLIAALLLTLSPLFINFAQMVRMYSLSTCLAIGGSLALVYALENPTNSSMAWWAGTRVLMTMTAPINGVLLLPDILIFGFKFRKQPDVLLTFGKWLLLAIVLLLPSLWKFAFSEKSIDFLTLTINTDIKQQTSYDKHGFPSFKEVIRRLKHFTAFPYHISSKVISLFYQLYTIILVFLLSFSLVKKHRSGKLLWIAAWAFIPAATICLASQHIWNTHRYILFLFPYILILIAAGFIRFLSWHRTVAIIVAVIYFVAVGNGLVHYYTVQERQDWRGITQVINTAEKPGDEIVLGIKGIVEKKIATSLAHYYNATAPISYNGKICRKSLIKSNVDLETRLGSLLSAKRFWLLCEDYFDEMVFQKNYGTKFKLQKHWEFTNNLDFYSNDIMHLFLASNIEKNQ